MLNSAKDLSVEAQNKYKKFSTDLADLSQDVTSVYLPEMNTICDGNGWVRGNLFSRMYEVLVAVTPEVIEGKDKVPERNGKPDGKYSMETIMEKLYGKDSAIGKEIRKAFAAKYEKEKEIPVDGPIPDDNNKSRNL